MRFSPALGSGVLIIGICLCLQGQDPESSIVQMEAKGLPPRLTPADYQAQAKAGTLTLAAEFKRHAVPTMEAPLTTEEFVVVEAGLFGPPDAQIKLSADDFSLRINGRRPPLPAQRYGLVVGSLKDPEWEPPETAASKSKTGLSGGGGQAEASAPATPARVPIALQRAMAQRVQRAALPEGDRPLPQAGLLFFQYRGKAQSIRSVELIYAGPAGEATLKLQP